MRMQRELNTGSDAESKKQSPHTSEQRWELDWTGSGPLQILLNLDWIRCQAKLMTCEISDFTPSAHAQSNILHIKYAEKTDD